MRRVPLLCLLLLLPLAAANRRRHRGPTLQGSPPICKEPPPWRLGGDKVMEKNRGNITLVALMELNCQFCATQISGIKNLVRQVATNAMQRFSFIIVAPRNETRAWVSYWKRALKPEGIQVYQESGRNPIWHILQGRNHDFFIYDRCGRLVYFIPHPQSYLYYHYTISSLTSAHNYAQCGRCDWDRYHRLAPLPANHPSTPSLPVRRLPPPLDSKIPAILHAPIRPYDPYRRSDPAVPTHPPTSPFPSVFVVQSGVPYGDTPPPLPYDPRYDSRRQPHSREPHRYNTNHQTNTPRGGNAMGVIYPQSRPRYTQPRLTYPPSDPRAATQPPYHPVHRPAHYPAPRRTEAPTPVPTKPVPQPQVDRAAVLESIPEVRPSPPHYDYVMGESGEEEEDISYDEANGVNGELDQTLAQIPQPTSPTPPTTPNLEPTRIPKLIDGISCEQFPDSVCYDLQEENREKGIPLHRCCYKGIYMTPKCVPKLCNNASYSLCCFQKFIQARYLCCKDSRLEGGRSDEFSKCCYQNFVELDDTDPCCPSSISRPYWSTKTALYELCMPNVQVDFQGMVLEALLRDGSKASVKVSELGILDYECPYAQKRDEFFYYQPPILSDNSTEI